MLVSEVMSAPVATVDVEASLDVAVERMLANEVGSLVVVEEGEDGDHVPFGILTATDVLRRSHDRDAPLSACEVEHAASRPLTTVAPDRTLGAAIERMIEEGVKHLPVVDGLEVVGIVTLTDVALRYDDIRDEAMDLVGQRSGWATDEED